MQNVVQFIKKKLGGLKRNGNVPSTAVNQIPFFRD